MRTFWTFCGSFVTSLKVWVLVFICSALIGLGTGLWYEYMCPGLLMRHHEQHLPGFAWTRSVLGAFIGPKAAAFVGLCVDLPMLAGQFIGVWLFS